MKVRSGLTSIGLLLLSACGSSPKTHFYTLSVVPGRTGAALSVPVQVAAVHLPPLLDRRQMVRMTGENSVEVSETDRWSANLEEMVRNVLAQDLAERLPGGKVIFPQAPAPAGARALVVTLAQFGPDAQGVVALRGSWSLLGPASDIPLRQRNFALRAGPAGDAEATAAAMSEVLGELASAIAGAL